MTIDAAKLLKTGDTLAHSGVWAYRIADPSTFTVVTTDEACIRVSNQRGYVSRYQWSGCSEFCTRDFFAACAQQAGR